MDDTDLRHDTDPRRDPDRGADPHHRADDDAVARVREVLDAHGLRDRVQTFAEPVPSAATAAARLGCTVGAIANSIVLRADGDLLLVLVSGAHRVDEGRLARHLGIGRKKIRRADPDLVATETGQRVGGVAPVGHLRALPTVVDTALDAHDVVWAGGGDAHTMFSATPGELLALTGGTAADVGAPR